MLGMGIFSGLMRKKLTKSAINRDPKYSDLKLSHLCFAGDLSSLLD